MQGNNVRDSSRSTPRRLVLALLSLTLPLALSGFEATAAQARPSKQTATVK